MSKASRIQKTKLKRSLAAQVPAKVPVKEIVSELTMQDVPISKIIVERNPRKHFDDESLLGLAQSIQARGLQQPIILEPGHGGTFVLVSGERRLRAHKKLGKATIQAILRARSNHDGRERFLDALIENDQRAEMTFMETAQAYKVLRDEFKLTIRQISKRIGKAESRISDFLLLTDLDEEIQDMIDEGFWKDTRLARGLLKIEDPATRVELARQLWKHKASLKGCLAAVENTLRATKRTAANHKISARNGTPSMILAEVDAACKPAQWDMLKQLGRVPAWDLVVLSAERTCQNCPLRSMASRITCMDCGAVDMLRTMMEAAHGNP